MNELSTEQKKSAYVAITKTISLFTLMFPHHNLLCWIRGSFMPIYASQIKIKNMGMWSLSGVGLRDSAKYSQGNKLSVPATTTQGMVSSLYCGVSACSS